MGFSQCLLRSAVLIAMSPLLCPQTPPTIRTETRVVQIDVDVRDSRGKPVAGLTKDDFTVTDAGKRRAIQIFGVDAGEGKPGPLARPQTAALPPNVFSNRSPAPRSSIHSTVIL